MVLHLQAGRVKEAISLLPATVEEAVKGTPIRMLARVVDEIRIESAVAFELIQLASLVNVDQRLNLQEHQVPFIAQQLVKDFRNESLADFHVCFIRGAMGKYDDKLLRLDGAVIGQWMTKYLEEKYQVIENNLMAEKENFFQVKASDRAEDKPNPERNLLALLKEVVGPLTPQDEDNAKRNAYERFKLENPYRYFTVRGIKVMARTQELAEKQIDKMIQRGELEEI